MDLSSLYYSTISWASGGEWVGEWQKESDIEVEWDQLQIPSEI